MATKVFMEALSPTMEEGKLVKWLKNEGDAVKSGEPIGEVETDKAIMELVARGDGVLRKRLVNEGESVAVGTLVGVIAAADENIDALVSGAAAPAPAAAAPAPEKVTAAAQPATDATPQSPPPAQAQGAASAPPQQKGAAAPAPAASAPAAGTLAPASSSGPTRSSPLARRLATERGLDLNALQGSGPNGRIIKRDIEAAGTGASPVAMAPTGAASAPRAASGGAATADFTDVPLTNIRKVIAKRLGESIGPIPTFYLTAELDLTRVMEMRKAMLELGDEFKVSVNDVLLKAIAVTLSQHPEEAN